MKKLYFSTCLFFLSLLNFNAQIIYTFAGNGTGGFTGDGSNAWAASLNAPGDIAFDAAGNAYIADFMNNRIRKVNTSGIISTFAGTGTAGFSGDGGLATSANLNGPIDVAVDASGNVYIADYQNHRIRKINTSGIISTVAGTGTSGFSGDGGLATAAQVNAPVGIEVDAAGNLIISDQQNARVRKVNTSGIISTIAGNGTVGSGGDGGLATAAQLNNPNGTAIDASGNIYIADSGNSKIRKVSSTGTITTYAGSGTPGFGGDGGSATSALLNNPVGVALSMSGNVIVPDYGNARVRLINGSGIITTIAGTGIAGYSGDLGPAIAAQINAPSRVGVDATGTIYICDFVDMRVRMMTLVTGLEEKQNNATAIDVYPNPTNGILNIKAEAGTNITVYNAMGEEVLVSKATATTKINLSEQAAGVYFVKVGENTKRIVKE
jgi:sugar lactone lactonase YvrE